MTNSKHGNLIITIIAIVFALAASVYIGIYFIRYMQNGCQTTEVTKNTVTDSVFTNGIIIRTESVISSNSAYTSITAEEGKKIGIGQEIAKTYNSSEDMKKFSSLNEINQEIEILETYINTDDAKDEDASYIVKKDIYKIKSACANRDFDEMGSLINEIKTKIIIKDADNAKKELEELKTQKAQIENSIGMNTGVISADKSGVYSSTIDGYESLTLADVTDISPSELQTILDKDEKSTNSAAIGKLVTEIDWYYVCVAEKNQKLNLEVGDTISVNFGKFYNNDVTLRVDYIGPEEGGKIVIIFSGDTDLSEMISLRKVSADIKIKSYTGFMIPKAALHTEDDSQFVYILSSKTAERKDVEVIYETDNAYIVSSDTLREGNELIVDAKNLYDGRVFE